MGIDQKVTHKDDQMFYGPRMFEEMIEFPENLVSGGQRRIYIAPPENGTNRDRRANGQDDSRGKQKTEEVSGN